MVEPLFHGPDRIEKLIEFRPVVAGELPADVAGIGEHVIEQVAPELTAAGIERDAAAEQPLPDHPRIEFAGERPGGRLPGDVAAVDPREADVAIDPRHDRLGAQFERRQRRLARQRPGDQLIHRDPAARQLGPGRLGHRHPGQEIRRLRVMAVALP